ncbi:uncharacterized protein LOC124146853 [Haliotis rufescens]|uniref:uncharacterized protein LOC124146853 n=1 Tax=Haliotis rufescens TaxID=6454 RepID=UPI00201F0B00|nr:uncharacterized protein LOC124146853 [Haliotis rufescens]
MEVSSSRGPFNRAFRELNNRNNLAGLKLRKQLASFDREKKFLMELLDKDKIDTYGFLKQLQLCESNQVPAYTELIQGMVKGPCVFRRRLRKAHTAPSAHSSSEDEQAESSNGKKPFVPKFTKAQIKLLQARKPTLNNHDRAEIFLKRLRDKQVEELEDDIDKNYDPEHSFSKKISRLLSVATDDCDPHLVAERWARPRGSGFHTIERLGNLSSRHRPCDLFEGPAPGISQTIPELVPIKPKDFRHSVTSPVEEELICPPLVPIKKPPIEMRLRTFYEKLDILKKKQDERMAEVPIWEKRRRWILLTRGLGAALAESDSESDEEMDRFQQMHQF